MRVSNKAILVRYISRAKEIQEQLKMRKAQGAHGAADPAGQSRACAAEWHNGRSMADHHKLRSPTRRSNISHSHRHSHSHSSGGSNI